MTQTVLILGGSGKIGRHATKAFTTAGWQVRQFNRKTDVMRTAAQGADVIVNGLNPPGYRNWETEIPRITAQVIDAAKSSGATVIIPGNIYTYGDQPGVLSADTPQLATTKKGRIRIEMERTYREAKVQTIILRAGNFIDPDSEDDLFSLVMLKDLAKGKVAAMGAPDALQSYAFLPDWARAAVGLAEMRGQLATFEDIPFAGHAFSYVEMKEGLEAVTGRALRLGRFPWWLMTALSPVWPLAREMREMRYLYSMPHRIDDRRLAELLPDFRVTPMDQLFARLANVDVHPDKTVRTGSTTVLS